jgi:hypothetical protein
MARGKKTGPVSVSQLLLSMISNLTFSLAPLPTFQADTNPIPNMSIEELDAAFALLTVTSQQITANEVALQQRINELEQQINELEQRHYLTREQGRVLTAARRELQSLVERRDRITNGMTNVMNLFTTNRPAQALQLEAAPVQVEPLAVQPVEILAEAPVQIAQNLEMQEEVAAAEEPPAPLMEPMEAPVMQPGPSVAPQDVAGAVIEVKYYILKESLLFSADSTSRTRTIQFSPNRR